MCDISQFLCNITCLKSLSPKERTLQHLLGTSKFKTVAESILYEHASLCMPDEHTPCMGTSVAQTCLFQPMLPLPARVKCQTYGMWKAGMDLGWRIQYIRSHKVIYIQPLDEFPDFLTNETSLGSSFFELLRDFAAVFFQGLPVHLRPPVKTIQEGWTVTSRIHSRTKELQYLVSDLQKGCKKILPSDGCCILGVTWTDLYPTNMHNFVLGEANSQYSAGVFCFGRFEPQAFVDDNIPLPISELSGELIWKMIKVLSHETCHVFGLAHCVFFHCAMNESTSLSEAMDQPLFLCPVCLKKLQKVCQFDVFQRYQALYDFLKKVLQQFPNPHIQTSVCWLEKCLQLCDESM